MKNFLFAIAVVALASCSSLGTHNMSQGGKHPTELDDIYKGSN